VENLQNYNAPLEGRRGLLRLDFNENTLGPSPKVVAAIRAIPAEHYAIYPEYNDLRKAFADSFHIPTHQIGLFNGVDAALHAICHAYGRPGDVLLTTSPTFGYYKPCGEMQGMAIKAIPYQLPDFCFPLDQIKQELHQLQPRLFLLCNPNNPTGTRLSATQVLELAATAPQTLLVVDELYEAFTGDSVLPILLRQSDGNDVFRSYPNLVVLRSLSKTAGIAGLRIGIAVGAAAIIDRLARVTGPYDINSFAAIAAIAALSDQAYVDKYVEQVLKAKTWLVNQLKQARVKHHVAGGNYLLIWPHQEVAIVDQQLRSRGILCRSMIGKPLIDSSLRVSIGTKEQMEFFWSSYAAIEGLEVATT
jgi:histidinol-phosphate aminotransferase